MTTIRTIRAALWCGLLLAAAALTQGQVSPQPRARTYAGEEGVLPAGKVMDAIGLKPGMTVGEAGAGWGYFTFMLAERVGPQGLVYANDIDQAALAELEAYRLKRGDTNVRTVLGAVDDPLFPAHSLDMIVIVNAFHDFEEPVRWLRNAERCLKPGAVIAMVEMDPWKFKPPYTHAWSEERIVGYAAEAGYALVSAAHDYKMHQVLVFRPSVREGRRRSNSPRGLN